MGYRLLPSTFKRTAADALSVRRSITMLLALCVLLGTAAGSHAADVLAVKRYLPYVTNLDPVGKIAFASTRNGNLDIWTIRGDGTELVQLTANPSRDASPVWSPDGKKLAFVSDRENNNDEIYVLYAATGSVLRLTGNPARDGNPVWSPDGKRIAFTRQETAYPFISRIMMMDVSDSGASNLVQLTAGPQDSQPSWSPDGQRIAFTRYQESQPFEGSLDIFSIDINGANLMNLTALPGNETNPAWSPDGQSIAFLSNRDADMVKRIWLRDREGFIRCLSTNTTNIESFAWARDQERIVCSQQVPGTEYIANLWILILPTGAYTRLTSIEAVDTEPSWWP